MGSEAVDGVLIGRDSRRWRMVASLVSAGRVGEDLVQYWGEGCDEGRRVERGDGREPQYVAGQGVPSS